MNDNYKDRIEKYHGQSTEIQELIGALALNELEDIDKTMDLSFHTSKTTNNESTNQ